MAKNPKKLDYYSFFTVQSVLELSECSAVLLVSFDLWEESLNKPKESVLKISQFSKNNEKEAEYLRFASRLHSSFPCFYHSRKTKYGILYFIEYCKGPTLGKFINECIMNPINISRFTIAYTLKSIIKSIKILHSNKIAHRDVKLDNIFITFENYLKLGDFGSTKLINECDFQTVSFSNDYKSPELQEGNTERDPYKDDVWAFGISALKFITQSSLSLDGKTEKEILHVIEDLGVDNYLKGILYECLKIDEEARATSGFIFDRLKEYCGNLKSELNLGENEYQRQKKIDFKVKKVKNKHLKQLNKAPISKNRCVICKTMETPIICYRKFHKVHEKCLFNEILRNVSLHHCVVCNIFDKNHEGEEFFRSLQDNTLIFRCCNKIFSDSEVKLRSGCLNKNFSDFEIKFGSGKCSHFFSGLSETYQSIVFKCPETNEEFCSLCSNNENHIHCLGYKKHLENYEKKYIISQKNNEKVLIKKYKLAYWQKNHPIFKATQIMKKFLSSEQEISSLHIHEFLSTISEDFLKLDFWYEKPSKNKQIKAFYEYIKGKTLKHEIDYRSVNSKIRLIEEECQAFYSFLERVLKLMHQYNIYHFNISLRSIFIELNSEGRIHKFKLGKFRKARLFMSRQVEYEYIDIGCANECLQEAMNSP